MILSHGVYAFTHQHWLKSVQQLPRYGHFRFLRLGSALPALTECIGNLTLLCPCPQGCFIPILVQIILAVAEIWTLPFFWVPQLLRSSLECMGNLTLLCPCPQGCFVPILVQIGLAVAAEIWALLFRVPQLLCSSPECMGNLTLLCPCLQGCFVPILVQIGPAVAEIWALLFLGFHGS